jgi:hypothetical protein
MVLDRLKVLTFIGGYEVWFSLNTSFSTGITSVSICIRETTYELDVLQLNI